MIYIRTCILLMASYPRDRNKCNHTYSRGQIRFRTPGDSGDNWVTDNKSDHWYQHRPYQYIYRNFQVAEAVLPRWWFFHQISFFWIVSLRIILMANTKCGERQIFYNEYLYIFCINCFLIPHWIVWIWAITIKKPFQAFLCCFQSPIYVI